MSQYRKNIQLAHGSYSYMSLQELTLKYPQIEKLPFSLKILLENLLRQREFGKVSDEHIENFLVQNGNSEFPFLPSRVLLQDFTGVPALVDLATMREAVVESGGDAKVVNPSIPVALVIDHSIAVDVSGSLNALERNMEREFERNFERYTFLKWASTAFSNVRVIPPGAGIVHQVHLEYLAEVVALDSKENMLSFDTVVGTDSHTTMVNGLGVLGWGVGGIEAEAAMLGQPFTLSRPKVVGLKLTGELQPGVTATDLVLHVTEVLRNHGVVDKFVEFFGPGVTSLSLADRATVANMAPEYGATVGYFPIDERTLEYLRLTGRDEKHIESVQAYAKIQRVFYDDSTFEPSYDERIDVRLETIETVIAGPKRPQDRIPLSEVHTRFLELLTAPKSEQGFDVSHTPQGVLQHGSIVIAAVTSCTNTSNPSVMLACGLLAKNAVARGLRVPPHVKTSLAPGSRVVTRYLEKNRLLASLEELGFNVVGYGCTTCIGNSGPLSPQITFDIENNNVIGVAVLSGNRNFEGRIHPLVKANFLASPVLVVAYALAGRIDIDFANSPLGYDTYGKAVYLRDIWPDTDTLEQYMRDTLSPELFLQEYKNIEQGTLAWKNLACENSDNYTWRETSTYIRKPPFFEKDNSPFSITNARILAKFSDSITTDHISPAGDIDKNSEASSYLLSKGVLLSEFNSYGSRRGNHEVMVRGTFANIRLRNELVSELEGGFTRHYPSGEVMSIYSAAIKYMKENVPLIIIAGKDYGMGSSRDWAAKGVKLLGVRAVLCESIERIHRQNLIGMGVLPLQFLAEESWETHDIVGDETITCEMPEGSLVRQIIRIIITQPSGERRVLRALVRLDNETEAAYFQNGGIMSYVLKNFVGETVSSSSRP